MPRGFPQSVKDNLEKARSAAVAAVETYNRPGARFRTAQFIVLIVMAWTALLHAHFYRKRRNPWYRKKTQGRGVRYVKVDGDPKHWELSECLRQRFQDQNPPERKNLEFLIGLRDKIEHRHLPMLDSSLYGECQASLLNFEAFLVAEFGARYALTDQLALALQFSQIQPDEKAKATKAALVGVARGVIGYIENFRAALPAPTLSSMKYSFSVFLVPRVANRASAADAAVQFVRVDEASAEELARLEKLNVLIKEKHIPIANLGLFKPGDVVEKVRVAVPTMTIALHTAAWRHFKVRPGSASDDRKGPTRSTACTTMFMVTTCIRTLGSTS
jgi:hypothetical protein